MKKMRLLMFCFLLMIFKCAKIKENLLDYNTLNAYSNAYSITNTNAISNANNYSNTKSKINAREKTM